MTEQKTTTPRLLSREEQLAAQLKVANQRLDAVHNLHSRTSHDRTRCYCGNAYPCRTIQAIDGHPSFDIRLTRAITDHLAQQHPDATGHGGTGDNRALLDDARKITDVVLGVLAGER